MTDHAARADTDGPVDPAQPVTRAQRRARTHAAILHAARQAFAENGYQKATIRAVADRAGCHPALVMQHFGTKNALFRAATAIDLDVRQAIPGPAETRTERILRYTFARLDGQRDSASSALRSILTHDQFAGEALQLFNPPEFEDAAIGDDADLRRELVTALILGTAITRYVLITPAVRSAPLDRLLAKLLPAAEVLDPPVRTQAERVRPGRTPVGQSPADTQQRAATIVHLTGLRAAGSLSTAQVRMAAVEHGVSERTVRRWLASGSVTRTPRPDRYDLTPTDRAAFVHYRGNATAAWRARAAVIAGRAETGPVPQSLVAGWSHARPIALRTWQRAYAEQLTAAVTTSVGDTGSQSQRRR